MAPTTLFDISQTNVFVARPFFTSSFSRVCLTLGFVRSVSLFACVDGFRDVFVPSVGQILDLSTNFFACGCDLLQSAPLSFAGTVDWTFLSRKAIFVCSMHR